MSLSCLQALDWQAIATLVTGILAVGAAFYVGRKQTEIQRRQTKLIENGLRIQLLDKRTNCVASMRRIHHAWHREMTLSDKDWREFYRLSEQVTLLFPKGLTKSLDEAVAAIFWAKQHYKRSDQFNQRGKAEEAEKRLEAAFSEEDKVMKILPKLLEDLIEYTRVDTWE